MNKTVNKPAIFRKVLIYIFLTLTAVTVIIPFINIVLVSLGNMGVLSGDRGGLVFSVDNYRRLFTEHRYGDWLKNSLILAACSMALSLALTSFTVYVFSRLRFEGKTKLYNFIILIQVFPLTLSMVSMHKIFAALGLLNKIEGLILVDSVLSSAGLVVLAKGYFDTIPYEIDEAAQIDGAGAFKIFLNIVLPLVKPMLAIIALQSFVIAYNEYVIANVVMSGGFASMPLAVGLQSMITGQYGINWSKYCAGAVIGSVPMLILFYSLQKYFIGGMTDGGVKT